MVNVNVFHKKNYIVTRKILIICEIFVKFTHFFLTKLVYNDIFTLLDIIL
ncbi:hypothetical protein B4168_3788 [Anoxybacillus flavithermus]|nr:hypothetical protein B4168_3788 [Anoxybacillus flavithermus]OAO88028.1 hypothetical protein GT23_0761 [Parageobacillus thermoglucosidasius]